MKNKKAIYEEIQNLITTFCVFFALCGFVVSSSFMLFFKNIEFKKVYLAAISICSF